MKTIMKRLLSLSLVLVLCITLCLNVLAVSTTPARQPNVYNTGTRHELCTDLSSAADAYYADYDYETLSALPYQTLVETLYTLMKTTHAGTSAYANCRDWTIYTDCEDGMGVEGQITMLYSSYQGNYSEYSSGQGWNREHVWPKSLGGFGESGAGADLHHIRPAEQLINSTRNNCIYGNVPDELNKQIKPGNLSKIVAGERGTSYDYFEPLDNVKGDVARICLYVYVRYGAKAENLPLCQSITNVFESVEVLLEWCALDPVDEWEMSRNDVVEYAQGNRNVFIDYPEYAWLIFGEEVPENLKTPYSLSKNADIHEHTYTYTLSGTGHIGVCTCGETTEIMVHVYDINGICIQCSATKPADRAIEEFEEAVSALSFAATLREQYEALYAVSVAFANIENASAVMQGEAYNSYLAFISAYNLKVFNTYADLKKASYRPLEE